MTMRTSPKLYCFVIMPFDPAFDDVYALGIKEACALAGAYCERVDEQIHHESVLQRIYNQIAKADVVIAEMSGQSVNVFYEVGYAHALNKPTILLTSNEQDIPFDLKHFPHIVYGSSITSLRESLKNRVRYYVENPPDQRRDVNVVVELYLGQQNLAKGDVVYLCPGDQYPRPRISVANMSTSTLRPGDFKLGIFAHDLKRVLATKSVEEADMISGERLYLFSDFKTLYPQQVVSFDVTIKQLPSREPRTVYFRLFTASGVRDYTLTIQLDESITEDNIK